MIVFSQLDLALNDAWKMTLRAHPDHQVWIDPVSRNLFLIGPEEDPPQQYVYIETAATYLQIHEDSA